MGLERGVCSTHVEWRGASLVMDPLSQVRQLRQQDRVHGSFIELWKPYFWERWVLTIIRLL